MKIKKWGRVISMLVALAMLISLPTMAAPTVFAAGQQAAGQAGGGNTVVSAEPMAADTVTIQFSVTPAEAVVSVVKTGAYFPETQSGSNSYTLEKGAEYTYSVQLLGYDKVTKSITPAADENITVAMVPMTPVTGQVTVRIESYTQTMIPEMTIEIMPPYDLVSAGYSNVNDGAYTVMHALLDALHSRNVPFGYGPGYISSVGDTVDIGDIASGQYPGWQFIYNGDIPWVGADAIPVGDGDEIVLFYSADYPGAKFGHFDTLEQTVQSGQQADLTLSATGISYGDFASYGVTSPCAGAQILVNGVNTGLKTDEQGSVSLSFDKPGSYYVKAELYNDAGQPTLTHTYTTIRVESSVANRLQRTIAFLVSNIPEPKVGMDGGEWAVLATARGVMVHNTLMPWYSQYFSALNAKLAADFPSGGTVLPDGPMYTTALRVALALSSVGMDANAYTGWPAVHYDFIGVLLNKDPETSDFAILKRGLNELAYGLIALDSNQYLPQEKQLRGKMLTELIRRSISEGGWNLSDTANVADSDMTGVVLQALAPYYRMSIQEYSALGLTDAPTHYAVYNTVEKAISALSKMQNADGGFNSPYVSGQETSESAAQVVTAMSALGIDIAKDARLQNNGKNPLTRLEDFRLADGSYKHLASMTGFNLKATEQAAYALAAYDRFLSGSASLFDMSDAFRLDFSGAPILAPQGAVRLSAASAAVNVYTTTAGDYYYKVVEHGAPVPAVDTTGMAQGYFATSENVIRLDGLVGSGAKDLYLVVKTVSAFGTQDDGQLCLQESGQIAVQSSDSGGSSGSNSGGGGTSGDSNSGSGSGGGGRAADTSKLLKLTIPAWQEGGQGPDPDPDSGSTKVYFTLLGDTVHGASNGVHTLRDGNLPVWITRIEVSLKSDATMYDVFTSVLVPRGYSFIGAADGYVKTITHPNGTSLSEMTNGNTSGWMYTINGVHVSQSLTQQKIRNGDEIVWHYTDDFTKESGSLDGTGNTGAGTGGGSGGSGTVAGGTGEGTSSGLYTADGKLLPYAVKNKDAANTLVFTGTLAQIIEAVRGAKEAFILDAAGFILPDEQAVETVEIPTALLAAVAEKQLGLTVQFQGAAYRLSAQAVQKLNEFAEMSDLSLTIRKKSVSELSELLQEQVENNGGAAILELNFNKGRTALSTALAEKDLAVLVPFALERGKRTGDVTAWMLEEDGSITPIAGEYDNVKKEFVAYPTGGGLLIIGYTGLVTNNGINTGVTDETPFEDVAVTDWFYDSVLFAYQSKLFSGTSQNAFSPNEPMTRGMLVTVLGRLAQVDPEQQPADGASFTDVPEGEYFAPYVRWASENAIVSGIGEGLFAPDSMITREDFAVLLYRFQLAMDISLGDAPEAHEPVVFDDETEISDYAREAVSAMSGFSVINGKPGTIQADGSSGVNFDPKGNASRAEVATMLYRFVNKMV